MNSGSYSGKYDMETKPIILNIGAGVKTIPGMISIDLYGNPDIRWDLNKVPWPFEANSVDQIFACHVFEHLPGWWDAFQECARILKPGGVLDMRVPDESSSKALTFKDHVKIFDIDSFHGIIGVTHPTNAWVQEIKDSIPFNLVEYFRVPFQEYYWMTKWPWKLIPILPFCAKHMRNFIREQRFVFRKI
jgi:SAM-dependent methyltransferase